MAHLKTSNPVCSSTRQVVYGREPKGCPVASAVGAQQSPTCAKYMPGFETKIKPSLYVAKAVYER